MKYLGVDHGRHTGFGLIEDGKYIRCGMIVLQSKDRGKLLKEFHDEISTIITEINPDVICVEKPMHMRNAGTVETLMGYYNMLHYLAYINGKKIIEVYPTSMKKKLAKDGSASKETLADFVASRLNIPIDTILEYEYYKKTPNKTILGIKKTIKRIDYDKSDALGLALYSYLINNKEEQ